LFIDCCVEFLGSWIGKEEGIIALRVPEGVEEDISEEGKGKGLNSTFDQSSREFVLKHVEHIGTQGGRGGIKVTETHGMAGFGLRNRQGGRSHWELLEELSWEETKGTVYLNRPWKKLGEYRHR